MPHIVRFFEIFLVCILLLVTTIIFLPATSVSADATTTATTSTGVTEPLISFDFDDGNKTAYQLGLPIINSAGFKATEYIITKWVGSPNFISIADVLDMQAKGNEIGAHTRHHVHFQSISDAEAKVEIEGSRQDLFDLGVTSVTAFAYPFGERSTTTAQLVKDASFTLARLTYPGVNDSTIDPYSLRRFPLNASTTPLSTYAAIDQAIANKKWLILVLHHIDQKNSQSISSAFLQEVVEYVKQKNVRVVTATEGYNLVFATTTPITNSATSTPYNTATTTPVATTDASSSDEFIEEDHEDEVAQVTPAVVPTNTVIVVSSGGGGGGGGGGGFYFNPAPTPATTTASSTPSNFSTTTTLLSVPSGQVLGATAFKFIRSLRRGMSGDDVIELQKTLRTLGYLTIDTPTNFYGALTEKAVKAYQKAKGLEQVGSVGPKTLVLLNTEHQSSDDAEKRILIDSLLKQVQTLLTQIAILKANQASTTVTSTR